LEIDSKTLRQKHINEIESDYKLGKDYIKHLIADLQKQPSINKAQKAQQEMEKVRDELGWKSASEAGTAPEISIGQAVKVLSLNQTGVVAEIAPETVKDPVSMVTVRCGNLRIKVPKSDLEITGQQQQKQIQQAKQPKPSTASSNYRTKGNAIDVFVRTAANTLDLRGKRVDDGLSDLTQFMDDNLLTGTSPLMIIHGHGTGAMKSAVRDYLHNSIHKGSFRPGDIHEGGDGVTMVTL
jgi:DNA mismatch repair protein MutS2